jgi:hypothetical protein
MNFKAASNRVWRRYRRSNPDDQTLLVFGSEVQFTGINFVSPSLVSFSDVNLSRAYLQGTNLRGARFLNVVWWQEQLGRNGLYDEIFIAHSGDGAFRWRNLPILEETYRNLRVALEESKSYAAAADFYVGEMETHRARLGFWRGNFFSVPAWYRVLTKYGTGVGRGMLIIALLVLFHAVGTGLIQHFSVEQLWSQGPELVLRSVQLATLQHDDSSVVNFNFLQRSSDTAFRIMSAIQIALLIFAFRTRIKRH